jgi:hypothetical protein
VSDAIWAKVVSWPCPWAWVPTKTWAEPVGWIRIWADSTRARPPVAGAVAALGPKPQISIQVEMPIPR